MIFLPHGTDLSLARRPYVTYAVILLCVVIHFFQQQNRDKVAESAAHYCELINFSNGGRSIHGLVDSAPELEPRALDFLRERQGRCAGLLAGWHEQPNKDNIGRFIRGDSRGDEAELTAMVEQAKKHYQLFATHAPGSLDEKLMYDPATPDPIRMITSSLAHADWGHLIFNLIFFFAFAPALEVMCMHPLRYLGVLVVLCFTTSVAYSLFSLGSSTPIPTLGLSGVVMGMIGLSAYMRPHARIRTFVWFIFFAKNIHIPAWILAAFYIGDDLLTLFGSGNSGGINVVAHVSGGISGYLIGMFWLKQQKEEAKEELEEEMEYRRDKRNETLGTPTSTSAGQKRMVNQMREYQAKREYQEFVDRLHTFVDTGQDSEAVALLLKDSDHYADTPDIYDELLEEFLKWRAGRATLCLGRFVITLQLESGRTTRALEVVKRCQVLSPEFVVADPRQNGSLLKVAIAKREYELAYRLLHNAGQRYGESIDNRRYRFMEAQLLIKHLQRYDEAKSLLMTILSEQGNPYRERAQQMVNQLEIMA
jgi:membrane associated rhomboid family serine protease